MPLIERLMGWNEEVEPKVAVNAFFAACHEILSGALTVAQVKTYLAMDVPTEAEFDALIATAPTGTTALAIANKAMFIIRVHGVFLLAEIRAPGYGTPTAVRTKLGI